MKPFNVVRKYGSGLATRTGAAILVGTVAAMTAVPSFAQTVTFDPAETLALVTDAKAFITAVGLAVLGLIMLAKGIKWVRKAG